MTPDPDEVQRVYWRAVVLREGPRCVRWLLRKGLTSLQARSFRRTGKVVFYKPGKEELPLLWFRAAMDALRLRPAKWRVVQTTEGELQRWEVERLRRRRLPPVLRVV